ncbi:MAG: D-ribitol-5-phosphate phosphatase [Chlamydiae bacterium]|nr:D-ribitol-5-phosphate phosphatase [Chlamydiota bacterium]
MESGPWKDNNSGGKMSIKTLFFDLGGVLINFSHEKMCQNIARYCDLDLDIVKTHLFEKKLAEDYERGAITSQTLHKHFSQLSGKMLVHDGLMEAASDIFSLKKETPALLEACKRKNISLILLSNTCEPHFCRVQKQFDFLKLFDGFVLSYEVGARKPEKKIYDEALKLANCPIKECFYVDDVAEYIEAARGFGIDSHLFEGADGLIMTLEKKGIV